jgi:hypothetical protein
VDPDAWPDFVATRDDARNIIRELDCKSSAGDLVGLSFDEVADVLAADDENGSLIQWRVFTKDFMETEPRARRDRLQLVQACLNHFLENNQ